MANDDGELFDELMADGFLSYAFMLQVALHIAGKEPDPHAWARKFISALHERMDANEEKMGAAAMRFPVHEIARRRVDALGHELLQLLDLPATDRGGSL